MIKFYVLLSLLWLPRPRAPHHTCYAFLQMLRVSLVNIVLGWITISTFNLGLRGFLIFLRIVLHIVFVQGLMNSQFISFQDDSLAFRTSEFVMQVFILLVLFETTLG